MPIAGDRQRGRDIGVKSKTEGSRWYVWIVCPECGKSRWVQERETIRPRYTGGLCLSCVASRKGELNQNWKGGIKLSGGYILERCIDHPRVNRYGYVRQHILVWEREHNQRLPDSWIVHHYNGVKNDNRPANLVAMKGKAHDRLIPILQERIAELEKALQEMPDAKR